MPVTINSLVTTVALALGNRADLASGAPPRIAGYLADSYKEIACGYLFEELEMNFEDQFLQNNDTYNYPAGMRSIKCVTAFDVSGNPREVRQRALRNVRRYPTYTQSIPEIYAPFNQSGQYQILVRPVPDQTYSFTWDGYAFPTITVDVISTVIQLPLNWIEVLTKAATMRGHIDLLERDKAGEIHQFLYGGWDKASGRFMPGLVRQLTTKRVDEYVNSEFAIQPRIRRYGNVP